MAAPHAPTDVAHVLETLDFLWPSLVAAGAIGVAGSVVGVIALLRREGLIALALPHVVVAGTAAAMLAGIFPLLGAIGGVVLALVLIALSKVGRLSHLMLPAIYVGALSVAFVVVANIQEHLAQVQQMFTGGIDVAVTPRESMISCAILLTVATVTGMLWRRWLLIGQLPEMSRIARVNPTMWNGLFLCLLSTVLLVGVNTSGLVMVLVMLFLPAPCALAWTRRIPTAMFVAVVLSVAFLLAGWYLSVAFSWPLSHSIGAAGFCVTVVMLGSRALIR